MITINNVMIGDIPMLHVVHQERTEERLPFIIFLHGYTSAKEHNLHFAYLLSEKGFRVVLPDAPFHGGRETKVKGKALDLKFWEIVVQSVSELAQIKEYFTVNHLIDDKLIGVGGTSMGAITTYGALAQYDWINSAVSLMGSPYYQKFAISQIEQLKKHRDVVFSETEIEQMMNFLRPYDLSCQVEKLKSRPLFIWHGQQDVVVPYHDSVEFYDQLRPIYENNHSHRLKFISTPEIDHKVPRDIVLETVAWFDKCLNNF